MRGTIVEVTPTIDTNIYAAGDQLGTLMTLTGVNEAGAHVTTLDSVVVIDKAKQGAAIDLLVFDAQPTIASSDNAAADVSDAELADKCIAKISIAEADYIDLNANSVGTKILSSLLLKPSADRKLYVLAVSQGTPTYGSTSDLVFKFAFKYQG